MATLAALSRFVEGAYLPAAAALIVLVAVSGSARLQGDRGRYRWQFRAADSARPCGLRRGRGGAPRSAPVPWLAAIFGATWLAVGWAAAVEADPSHPPPDGSHARPVAVRLGAFGLAFAAFAAVGGLVPGSIPGGGRQPDIETSLAALTLLIAAGSLAGLRIATVRPHTVGGAVAAACQYTLVLVSAGAVVWVLGLPRLFGPALLLLAAYLATSWRERKGRCAPTPGCWRRPPAWPWRA